MKLLGYLLNCLPDFFGRRKLVETHDPILERMEQVTQDAKRVTQQATRRSFPIARTVGNPRLRRSVRYEHL